MHGSLNIQVSNSEGTVGRSKLFARDCVKGSSQITILVISVHFCLPLQAPSPPQNCPGAKRATDLGKGKASCSYARARNAPRAYAGVKSTVAIFLATSCAAFLESHRYVWKESEAHLPHLFTRALSPYAAQIADAPPNLRECVPKSPSGMFKARADLSIIAWTAPRGKSFSSSVLKRGPIVSFPLSYRCG